MKNPVYYRLLNDGQFVGFKRVVTEFLPAGHGTWQLDEEKHDETQKLSRPPVGIENLKRQSFSKRKVKNCKDADESRIN